MKICLISAFPPSKMVLNEYGYHVAQELQDDPLVSLTVLADEMEADWSRVTLRQADAEPKPKSNGTHRLAGLLK